MRSSSTGLSAATAVTSSLQVSCVGVGEPVASSGRRAAGHLGAGDRASLPAGALPRLRQSGRGRGCPRDVASSAFGPRLQAAVATLSVRNRVSRRDVVELCEELFGARICAGTVDAILTRAADALEEPYEDLLGARARQRELEHGRDRLATERRASARCGACSPSRHAVFAVAPDRHEEHAKRLLAGHAGDRDLRPLVGLRASAARTPPALLVTPPARLPSARRRPRRRERVRRARPAALQRTCSGPGRSSSTPTTAAS